ncbi:MAG: helix-turn-helix transcriptional regulator [Schwartzia sp.]|nr:helix-turn-helix transcriptional regulator [Schwartzia sp. (in: firmicutes)]
MDFGARIRAAREQLGIARDELAKKINIQYYTLAKYESSTREPDYNTLVFLANALRVSTDYILGCTEDQIRLKRKGFDADAESLLLKYQTLSEDAKDRIQNQVSFEYAQQRASERKAKK